MGGDDFAVGGVDADFAWQRQQFQCFLECDGGRFHRREEGGGGWLQLLVDQLRHALFLLRGGGFGFPVLGAFAFFGALFVLFGALGGDDFFGAGFGGGAFVVTHELGDVWAEAPFLCDDHTPIGGVLPQFASGLRGGEEFLGHLECDFVRGCGFGQVGALVFGLAVLLADDALDVGAVAADADDDGSAFGVVEKFQRVRGARVDGFEVVLDHVLQAAAACEGLGHGFLGVGVAKVEAGEPLGAVLVAVGDFVEFVFHGGGEVVVHERVEVVFQQPDDGERHPGRHECVAADDDVAAVLDRLNDRRVGGRAADAEFFHLLHQRRFVVARRRVGGVAVGGDGLGGQFVALGQLRQAGFVGLAVGVGAQPAGEGDGAAGCSELASLTGGVGGDGDLGGVAACVFHLGGDGALPDQFVELELFGVQRARQLSGGGEAFAGGADRLVGFLGVFHLAVVDARFGGDVVGTVELACCGACGVQALLGQGGGVCTHVGDVAVFVQALRDAHGARGGEVEFAAGFLLQRRGHERRVRFAGVGLFFHCGDVHRCGAEVVDKRMRFLLIDDHRIRHQLSPVIEVAALGDALAVEGDEFGVKFFGGVGERSNQVPVFGGDERHALAFALDDDAGSHGLDAAGGQARHDFLPQHGGNFVAVEAVEDAAGLLGVDKIHVELAGVFGGFADGRFGDLVEHHALYRHLGLECFKQVPRDRFTFAVRVCCQQEFVGLLELGAQVGDLLFLVGGHDVDRVEALLRVDAEFCPRLVFVLRGDVGGAARQVTDVAHRCFHDVIVAEILLYLLRLCRGLHDHESLAVCSHADLSSIPTKRMSGKTSSFLSDN